jgi:membrane-anchored protein YejM (alkaline phosphatase superfamily)
MTTLLALDTMILVMAILSAFIVYMVYSGEVPMRWLGSIHRDSRPLYYWLGILFYIAILGVVIYAWMDGVRIPLDEFVGGLFD